MRKSDSEQDLCLVSEGKWRGTIDVCNMEGQRLSEWWHGTWNWMLLWKRERQKRGPRKRVSGQAGISKERQDFLRERLKRAFTKEFEDAGDFVDDQPWVSKNKWKKIQDIGRSRNWVQRSDIQSLGDIWSWTVPWRITRPFRTNIQKHVLFVIGDWNAKVGSQETPGATGKFGLGVQNEAGHRLIEFCQENALVIANILFQQHKRRLYSWTSPDGQHQNQIDYILCSKRLRSSIQSAETRPGADCGSDHELLIAKFILKLKKVEKNTRPFRYDLDKILYDYTAEVRNRFKGLDLIDRMPDEQWTEFMTLYRRQG